MNADSLQRPALCGDYVMEGQFHAWPLSVPGECEAIEPDSSRICAVSASSDGRLVWGATRGRGSHVFAACFKGAAGGIIDLGLLPGNTTCVHLCPLSPGHPLSGTGTHSVLIAAGDDSAFSLWRQRFGVPRDAIQEPAFSHPDAECLVHRKEGRCFGLECMEDEIFCLTDHALYVLNPEPPDLVPRRTIHQDKQRPASRIAIQERTAWWIDESGRLTGCHHDGSNHPWRPHITDAHDSVRLITCPPNWLLAALPDGQILVLDPRSEYTEPIARAPLPDIHCLAPLADGRVYGLCGSGIGHFFRIDLEEASCTALGAVATAVGSHRYAFTFSCADVTSEGVIVFGEDDRGGHLWTYYPPVSSL